MNYSKVSIIILNWNGLEDTIECLESLKKITYPNYEVIIIDNGSEGNDADILKKRYKEYTKIIKNKENLGFCGGNNVGIKRAIKNNSDYILLLNNDTTVEPNFLNELVKVAVQDKKIAVAGSVIADYYTNKIIFTNAKIDKKLKLERRLDFLNSSKDCWKTDAVSGASMMIKMKHLLKYSLFLDENLFMYCDETDFCIRAKRQGLKVAIAGKSKVYHKEGGSYGGGIKPIPVYYILRNRILLAKKLLPLKEKIIFWVLFIPARLFRILEWLVIGKWNLIKITYFALFDGIKGITGRKILKTKNNVIKKNK